MTTLDFVGLERTADGENLLDILQLVGIEASVVLSLGGGILVPAETDVHGLGGLVDLAIALKDRVTLVLGVDDVGARGIAGCLEVCLLALALVSGVTLGLLGSRLLFSEQLFLESDVNLLVTRTGYFTRSFSWAWYDIKQLIIVCFTRR